ncbi:MAG: zinc-ribbon domain-containing protein [Actinomycetia bacterium]|nr:zinc-ribbon domain-containing protein [Actinomycetes bacterium]MCP4845807.1 zinc-ribbon domain-containing protein [Actinomycetes bacterium]
MPKRQNFAEWAAANPELGSCLLAEWDYDANGDLEPADVYPKSTRRVHWACDVAPDHRWAAQLGARVANHRGCPFCTQRRPSSTANLAIDAPHLVAEWHPTLNGALTPTDVLSGARTYVWWACDVADDHVWEAACQRRTRKNATGCPACAGHQASITNTVATLSAYIVAEWHPTKNGDRTPEETLESSKKPVWWKCTEAGHEWERSPGVRQLRCDRLGEAVRGCPFCAGMRTTPEESLAATHPWLAAEWHPTKNGNKVPTDVRYGHSKKVWWICEDRHEWDATVASRTSGTGCPSCTRYGFKLDQPAILYLIHDPVEEITKVGLAQDTSSRLDSFVKRGWEVIDSEEYETGSEAAEQEKVILDYLRPMRPDSPIVDARVRRAVGHLSGGTECVPSHVVEQRTLRALVKAAEAAS